MNPRFLTSLAAATLLATTGPSLAQQAAPPAATPAVASAPAPVMDIPGAVALLQLYSSVRSLLGASRPNQNRSASGPMSIEF